MMLHRHFQDEGIHEGMTTSADLTGENKDEAFVSEVFPPEPEQVEKPKRGRKKTTTET